MTDERLTDEQVAALAIEVQQFRQRRCGTCVLYVERFAFCERFTAAHHIEPDFYCANWTPREQA